MNIDVILGVFALQIVVIFSLSWCSRASKNVIGQEIRRVIYAPRKPGDVYAVQCIVF